MSTLQPHLRRRLLVVLAASVLVGAALGEVAASSAERSAPRVEAVAAGGLHTCAVVGGGVVKCWGANLSGQLGDGTTTDHSTPVAVSGLTSGAIALSARSSHTCALLSGSVKCWGGNTSGQLGDRTTTNRLRPVTVSGLASGVQALAAGGAHSCALLSDGAVKCWGFNDEGQLGDGTTSDRATAVAVSGLANGIQAITAGFEASCALRSGGDAVCWGAGDYGQLGDGHTTGSRTPVAVSGLANVTAIAAGAAHACALLSGGAVKCWGRNLEGELGDGTRTSRDIPVPVSGLASGVQVVAGGDTHTCAVASGGGAKCWGANSVGQLGDGTTTGRSRPVSAVGLGAQSCTVPDVRGKTLRAAESAMARAHCKTGKVSRAYSTKVPKGRVISQRPGAGKKLASGGKVSLVVSRGK